MDTDVKTILKVAVKDILLNVGCFKWVKKWRILTSHRFKRLFTMIYTILECDTFLLTGWNTRCYGALFLVALRIDTCPVSQNQCNKLPFRRRHLICHWSQSPDVKHLIYVDQEKRARNSEGNTDHQQKIT